MKRGRLISLRRKPSLLLVILLRRLSRASSQYSTRISRSETIVFRSADSETLKWQPTLLVLKRWLVLAFVVSFIVLLGALFFASGEAYGKDGGESSPTSGDSGGGGSDKGSSGGDDGGSGGSGTSADKGGSGGSGGDSSTTDTTKSGGGGGGGSNKGDSGSSNSGSREPNGGGTTDTNPLNGSTQDSTISLLDTSSSDTSTSGSSKDTISPVTEPATEMATEPVTEPVTETTTEPATEPVTETVTEPIAPVTETETAPIETAPIETAPIETAPIESAPIETAPVEPSPVLSEPALVEQVGELVDALRELVDGLLGGAAGQEDMAEQVSGLVAKLKELVDGLLGGLLDGGETPNPGNMPTSPATLENLATALMRLVEVLHHSFFGQASNSSFGQVSNLPEQINSALVDIPPPISFSAFSAEGSPTPTERNQMPVQAPVPSPTPPVSSYLGGSGTLVSGDAPVLLLGVLASLAILMLGGRFSWPSYAILKPLSAIQLAIERPG